MSPETNFNTEVEAKQQFDIPEEARLTVTMLIRAWRPDLFGDTGDQLPVRQDILSHLTDQQLEILVTVITPFYQSDNCNNRGNSSRISITEKLPTADHDISGVGRGQALRDLHASELNAPLNKRKSEGEPWGKKSGDERKRSPRGFGRYSRKGNKK